MNNIAHDNDPAAKVFFPQTWSQREGLLACSFCGSMHPSEVVAALKAGATISFADQKYGWQHKIYLDNIANPNAGERKEYCSTSRSLDNPMSDELRESSGYEKAQLREEISKTVVDGVVVREHSVKWLDYKKYSPAPATMTKKFYTVHLKDATPEDKAFIEKLYGITYTFEGDQVSWKPFDATEQS